MGWTSVVNDESESVEQVIQAARLEVILNIEILSQPSGRRMNDLFTLPVLHHLNNQHMF